MRAGNRVSQLFAQFSAMASRWAGRLALVGTQPQKVVNRTKGLVQPPLQPRASPMILPTSACSTTASEVSFQTKAYKLHKLDHGPSEDVTLKRDDALSYYETMTMIRRMETAAGNLYKEKAVRGFCHLYSGQEAVAVGMRASMAPKDDVITAYRCHGWSFVMGLTVREILSELTGRVTGNVYGKGGSMHMYTTHFYGGNGIVGAQVPLGVGIAFASKYRGEKNVCTALYGDGAANQGQVFEAFNMAKLWQVPVIFVCENNGYGMGTAVERASASVDYYTRGDYIPGVWVDAMDILAVREATRFARDYVLNHGPIILDMATYRYHGHSMSDPGTSYRTRDEIQDVRKTRDPITGFKDKILTANLVTDAEVKEIDKRVRTKVTEAMSAARTDPIVDAAATLCDVYHNSPDLVIRGATVDKMHRPKHATTKELVQASAQA